ncbi:MAG: AGE family epimerase/isomerase [Spirochaetaceae bacterium]|nr:AGE family epimerase/isomerase [Spirochaetaceae bacterium]
MNFETFPFNEISLNLNNCIISFWKRMKDEEFGGFFESLDNNLNLFKKANKSSIQTCRILWFFSNAYLLTKNEECREYAKHAYQFLNSHLIDKEFGGVFWEVSYDGSAPDTTKTAFSISYAILALASFAKINVEKDSEEAKNQAFELQKLLEEKYFTENGYIEVLKRDFTSFEKGKIFFSKGNYGGSKTMNTILHVIEAYTQLYEYFPNSFTENKLIYLLTFFENKCFNKEEKSLNIFFDDDFNKANDYISYGHEAEASFLLRKACEILEKSGIQNKELFEKIEKMCSSLTENIFSNAYEDGSVVDEVYDEEVKQRRIYWVQADSLLSFFYEAYKNNKEKYLVASKEIWNFIKNNLIDSRKESEWLYMVLKNNKKSERPIVFSWKAPYNNARMCFEILKKM